MMKKTFYLCDGKKEDCKKSDCHINGGRCNHTSDIRHARNFQKRSKAENASYWEKETASENQMQPTD